MEKAGEEMLHEFEERMSSSESTKKFFDPIRKCKPITFTDSSRKSKVNIGGKCKEVMFQRDILGKLVALSHQRKTAVDLHSCLIYPLAPVSLPLSTPDGAIRKTVKSKFFLAAMSDLTILNFEDLPPAKRMQIYFLDLAAAIRCIVEKVTTIRDLATKIMTTIPKQYKIIYLLCDTYKKNSIKGGERQASNFLRNGDNKAMLFDLIQQSIEEDKNSLCDKVVYFSNQSVCKKTNQDKAIALPELTSDHEEADTKLVAFLRASQLPPGSTAMIRSPSGDIDIITLFVCQDFSDRQILIDNGTGKNRKIINVT